MLLPHPLFVFNACNLPQPSIASQQPCQRVRVGVVAVTDGVPVAKERIAVRLSHALGDLCIMLAARRGIRGKSCGLVPEAIFLLKAGPKKVVLDG